MELVNALSNLVDSANKLIVAIDNDTRVMTVGEAAYVLDRSMRSIYRYIDQGKLKKGCANGVDGVWARDVYKMIWKR